MAGWRPPDSTPLDEIREARSALAGAREFLEAEQGRPGRVDLAVLTGGNSLALQLLHDALGYRTTNVRKRSARSAIATASRVLTEVSKGRDPTVEKAVIRSLAQSNRRHSSRTDGTALDEAGRKVGSEALVVAKGDGTGGDQPSPAVSTRPSQRISAREHAKMVTQVRRLTDLGIERAKEFLALMRENPGADREPPRELLFGERYSRPFRESVSVERRSFRTRREAGEYFAPRFNSIRPIVADHSGLWSWLGIYYFAEIVRVKDGVQVLSPVDDTFVFMDSNDRHAYRHYLRGAWRLFDAHGEGAAFLLDQSLTSFGDLADRAFSSIRIFNSAGIIQLMLRLYTHGRQQKRGFGQRPGGLRHLIRVLDHLERTYDVYGMSPDALIRILPEEFRRWDSESAPRALETAAVSEPAVGVVDASPAYPAPAERVRGEPSDRPSANGDRDDPKPDPPSVRQTLLDVRARIEQQGQVSWADPREFMEEGSAAWKAYVAVCGVPERRLFRTAFLHRLDEALAALD